MHREEGQGQAKPRWGVHERSVLRGGVAAGPPRPDRNPPAKVATLCKTRSGAGLGVLRVLSDGQDVQLQGKKMF